MNATDHLIQTAQTVPSDFTFRQVALMAHLSTQDQGVKVRDAAKVLGVQKPIITRAANKLGDLGYVQRRRSEDDWRDCILVITTAGRAFLTSLVATLGLGAAQ